jgi:hypothetical protein
MGKYNKYDYFVLLLLTSLAAGGIGNGLQPVRILTVVFIPLLVRNYKNRATKQLKIISFFFMDNI